MDNGFKIAFHYSPREDVNVSENVNFSIQFLESFNGRAAGKHFSVLRQPWREILCKGFEREQEKRMLFITQSHRVEAVFRLDEKFGSFTISDTKKRQKLLISSSALDVQKVSLEIT